MSDDPYIQCRDAILEAVKTLTTYFPKDYQVTLNRSDVSRGADYWFLMRRGSFSDTRLEAHDSLVTWNFRCELAVRFVIYNERADKLDEVLGAVRAVLKKPHTLKNIRLKPPVLVAGEDLRQDVPGLTPNFIIAPLNIVITQIVPN